LGEAESNIDFEQVFGWGSTAKIGLKGPCPALGLIMGIGPRRRVATHLAIEKIPMNRIRFSQSIR